MDSRFERLVDQPAVKELKRRIKSIRSLDLSKPSLEFLKTALAPIVHCHTRQVPTMPVGQRVYRGVIWEKRPNFVRELSYPPREMVTSYQRANRPGVAMFYGSVGGSATVMEITPKIGDRLAISQWRVTTPITLVSCGYSMKALARMKSGRRPHIWWEHWHEGEPEQTRSARNRIVNEFLSQQFTRKVKTGEEWNYKISAAITEVFLNSARLPELIDSPYDPKGMIYPSVAADASADNVALLPEIARAGLELVEVHYVKVSEVRHNPISYSWYGIDYSNSVEPNGQLRWLGCFPNDKVPGTGQRITPDFPDLVIRDVNNAEMGRIKLGD